MSRLKSEVLFNRAMLWLVIAYLAKLDGMEMPWLVGYGIMSLWNVWQSLRSWEDW